LTIQALPFVILLGFLFGSTLIASRFGIGQFEPTNYIALRLALASALHLSIYLLGRPRRPWPRDPGLWKHAAVLGVFGTAVPMTAIVSSLQYQSAGLTSLLLTAGPAITVLMAHVSLPEERLTPRRGLGVTLALGGALLLAARGESGLPDVGQASPLGYGLVLLALLTGSATIVYARRFMRDYDFFDVASARVLVATLAVAPLSTLAVGVDLRGVDAQGYLALGYAALSGTFSALIVEFYIIRRFGSTAASMPTYVIPVVATLGGTLLLGEHVTPGMLAGIALILAGIGLVNQPD